MATKAQIKASNKFNKHNTKSIILKLNFNTDADIIKKLEHVPSKMGYIKKLIREDIKNNGAAY